MRRDATIYCERVVINQYNNNRTAIHRSFGGEEENGWIKGDERGEPIGKADRSILAHRSSNRELTEDNRDIASGGRPWTPRLNNDAVDLSITDRRKNVLSYLYSRLTRQDKVKRNGYIYTYNR